MIPNFDNIAAGLLIKDKKVFIAQRNDNDTNPSKWEFSGGTLKGEEQYDEALIREFKEEFDIDIEVTKEIGSVEHQLPDKVLIIMFFLINNKSGDIKLKTHKDSKFVSFSELKGIDFSDADKNFVESWEEDLKQYFN